MQDSAIGSFEVNFRFWPQDTLVGASRRELTNLDTQGTLVNEQQSLLGVKEPHSLRRDSELSWEQVRGCYGNSSVWGEKGMGLRKDIFLLSVVSMKIIKKSPDLPWKKRNPVQPEGGRSPPWHLGRDGVRLCRPVSTHGQESTVVGWLLWPGAGGWMDGWSEVGIQRMGSAACSARFASHVSPPPPPTPLLAPKSQRRRRVQMR